MVFSNRLSDAEVTGTDPCCARPTPVCWTAPRLPQRNAPSGRRMLSRKPGDRSARDIGTTGGIAPQPVESIDEAQHIRHQNVGDGKRPGQPCAFAEHRLHVLEAVVHPFVEKLRTPRVACIAGELEQ